MNVYEYLLAGKPRSATALITADAQYSFGDVEYAAEHVASLLFHSGAKKGDRAILLAKSGFFWVTAYLGIIRAGLVCVPLPTKIDLSELDYVVNTTEALYAFVDSQLTTTVSKRIAQTTIVTELQIPTRKANTSKDPARRQDLDTFDASGLPDVGGDELAALMFTSGSTGKPRGVMISHRNIIANTDSIIQYMGLDSNDRVMAVLPFDYCFGASLLHTHLRVGGSIVIESRFMYPQVILERLSETECTGFAGVPSHFQILLRRSTLSSMHLPHLRYVQQAGGQLAPIFIEELRKALPGKQIFIMYGQTEATARMSYLPPELLDTKLGSVGKGIPGVRLQVLNDLGLPVTAGESGEIVAEGDNVALGYWRDENETALSFRNGRLYTGDLATIDADGFIYVLDRAKDFLKCGGKRVSCRSVENALLEHTEILEAAVVGMADEILGEAALAFVVPLDREHPPAVADLLSHCKHRLPAAFVPKQFVMLKALPKNSRGKILKAELKWNQRNPVRGESEPASYQGAPAPVLE